MPVISDQFSSPRLETDLDLDVVIIGGGPAGLTSAYELSKRQVSCTVLEASGVVGGLARTVPYKGYLFDIGGHRFYTLVKIVEEMWREVLGNDLLQRPRLSRIYYRSKFFQYPLEPMDAFWKLGMAEALLCGLSYLHARLFPQLPEEDLESWVSNRFGRRLFKLFFQSYTEKVWGLSCRQIRADWAAQRIRGLSVTTLLRDALAGRAANPDGELRTLIREFQYPRFGPGMMWSKTREIVESRGSRVILNAPVSKIAWQPGRVTHVVAGGTIYTGSHFISSMPVRQLIETLDPMPDGLVKAAADFNYRDFLTVGLICKGSHLFPDNWIYIHEPKVKVGRIQNFGNWSPDMVPDPATSSLGLEYFCFEGDQLWQTPDAELIELGRRELAQLGLVKPEDVLDGVVIRAPKAYPVYDQTYRDGLRKVREFLEIVPNLQLVGRNGMHRYNNQDHSMLTAILAARNVLGAKYDLWHANVESQYGECGDEITEEDLRLMDESQPRVPATK